MSQRVRRRRRRRTTDRSSGESAHRTDGHLRAGPSFDRRGRSDRQEFVRPRPRWLAALHVAVYAVATAGAMLLLDATYAAVRVRSSLLTVNGHLAQGAESLVAGATSEADEEFHAALTAARQARRLQLGPGLALAAHLPAVGPDVATVAALSRAAEITTRAALAVVDGASAADDRHGLLDSLFSHGRVRFGAVRRIRPAVGRAESLLEGAQRVLEAAPVATLPFLRDAALKARGRLDRTASLAHDVDSLLGAAPSILGKGSPRRYFLAFQSPSEARGSGGFMGLYGVLTAENGRLSLEQMGPVQELALNPSQAVSGPGWFEARYEPFAGLWQWQQSNLAGHFPTVADVWLQMYRRAVGEDLDGVIAMDPVAFGDLTLGTGPLVGRGWPVEVGFENAAQVLLHDAYVRFEDRPEAQNRYLSSLVREMWGRLDRGEVSVSGVALGLSQAASTQHLKFYVKDRRAEAALREAGFDGTFRGRGSNVQFLWHNNLAANKVDYFLRRSIDITVVLTQGGDAKVLSAVSLQNSAPKGPPSELIGSGVGGDEPGLNRMQLNLLLPQEADIDRYVLDGRIRPLLEDEEAGFPVLWDIIDIPSRTTVTLQVAYTLPDAVDLTSGRGAFKMILFPQALAVPDRYSVRVVPPYEYAINYPTQGHLEDDGSLLQRGSLSRETAISAELTRR